MPHTISSEDFLACCLILAEGDTNISTEQVVLNAESYQKLKAGYFGVDDADFRAAFIWLGITEKLISLGQLGNVESVLQSIPLTLWIEPVLGHAEVYFNDEGEHWLRPGELGSELSERNRLMRTLFAGSQHPSAQDIRYYLEENEWDDGFLAGLIER